LVDRRGIAMIGGDVVRLEGMLIHVLFCVKI